MSILTVFINKKLLSGINLDAPMFIALYQTFITSLICFIKLTLSKTFPGRFSFPETNVFGTQTIKDVIMLHAYQTTNALIVKLIFSGFTGNGNVHMHDCYEQFMSAVCFCSFLLHRKIVNYDIQCNPNVLSIRRKDFKKLFVFLRIDYFWILFGCRSGRFSR